MLCPSSGWRRSGLPVPTQYTEGRTSPHELGGQGRAMNRAKVESVDVDQSVLGRIFGFGTVLVRGTGGSLEPMQSISDPLRFRSHITADAPPRPDATR